MCKLKYIIIIFLAIYTQSFYVDAKDKRDTPLFSVEQLREDFEFYIHELEDSHPNLYVYSSKEEFDARVKSIWRRIDKPMTKLEFGLLIMELNSLLDGHSGVLFYELERVDNHALVAEWDTTYHGKFLPWMDMRNNQMYYENEKVISINGKKAQDIIDYLNLRITAHDSYKRRDIVISHFLCTRKFSYTIFKLTSPFCIRTKSADGNKHIYEEGGWSIGDYRRLTKDIPTVPMECKLYPADSIACIDFNSCSANEGYTHLVDSIFEDIQSASIKYLFINVVFNEGGDLDIPYYVLSKMKHNAFCWPFEMNYKVSKKYCLKYDKGSDYLAENKGRIITDSEPMYYDEMNAGYSGQVFVIQSPWTFSAANDFCHLIRRSGRGLLIGGTTGQKNRVMYSKISLTLPHTDIEFNCSLQEYIHKEYNEDGLCPDMPMDIGIYQAKFTLDDLRRMLKLIKRQNPVLSN